MPKISVVQKPDVEEVPVEVLAQSIVEIASGMRKINSTRLSDRALLLLLRDATGVPMNEITKVLNCLRDLERLYLKPLKGEK